MSLVDLIIFGLATTKTIMIFQYFELPLKILGVIKKTKNDWLKIVLSKVGMFLDCPVCLSVVSAIAVLLLDMLQPIINIILAISVFGLLIKKKFAL